MDYYEDLIVLNYGKLILVGVASFVILNCEFPMASASFIVFFLLSHFASLVIFVGSCPPDDFPCGSLGKISFPFTSTEFPGCGLVMLNCIDEPFQTIQQKENGRWYNLIEITPEDPQFGRIRIHDQDLEKQLAFGICHTLNNFNNLSLPNSPSISFTFPNLTVFKCPNQQDAYFKGYSRYKKCTGYSIYYYNHTNGDMYGDLYGDPSMPSGSLPHQCSVIQLPSSLPPGGYELSVDPFTHLTAEFSLEYRISLECHECHGKGGNCSNDSRGNFRCLKKGISKSRVLILATGIPTALIGLVVIIFYCLKRKFFWKKGMQNDQSVEVFLQNYGSLAPKRYSYSDIKKMTFSFKDKLGQGGYGGVYKGKLHDGCLVAVKVLNESKGDGEEFINEVASICRTSHVNIVTLLGFCFEGSKRALIYEFMPNGSLEKFIYENPLRENRQLEWETLYQIAIGIARGLEYLHRGCKTRILHFDIKPHNILLDEDFCPKISDFGLAKLCLKKESIISMLGARGTAGYIAPEVFSRNFGGVSHKSDVYSYGMMVLEMVGGRKNIDVSVDNDSEIYFPHWIYKRLEQGHDQLGLHGVMNEEENEKARKMILVGLWCIQTDPSNRPSMSRVVEMLQGRLGSLQIPPRPFLSSPPRSPVDSSSTTVPIMTS